MAQLPGQVAAIKAGQAGIFAINRAFAKFTMAGGAGLIDFFTVIQVNGWFGFDHARLCRRKLVGNAFVAVNAGLADLLGVFMITGGKATLAGQIHGGKIMTVAAFPRIRFLHGLPDMLGQMQAFGFKLFRGIDRAD